MDRTERIATLNDQLRHDHSCGKVVITRGIQALGHQAILDVLAAVAAFSEFTPDNDPYAEHDCAVMRCGAEDARTIFHLTRQEWLRRPASGRELYEFAARQAAERGWKPNLDLSGHRLAAFPHAAIHDGPLAGVTPC